METAMAAFPASPPSSSSLLSSHGFLTATYCHWRTARGPIRSSASREAVTARQARRTLSSSWDLSVLSARPASRQARLEELDTTNMLLQQRIVFLGSQVDDMSADLVISQLLLLDAEDPTKDIKLFINSPGGSVTAGMGIYDAMKLCKANVSTICLGIAASMGAFLLAAGTKGKRLCMPNARIIIRGPSGGAGGKVMPMSLQLREMMYEEAKIKKILSRITGKSQEQIEADTEFDYYMNPWEAKGYGLLDTIIDDGKPGLVAPMVEPVAPPKSRVWYLWQVTESARKVLKDLPSEDKLLLKGNGNGTVSAEEKGIEKPEEASTT